MWNIKKPKIRLPGMVWLSRGLSRKMLLVLIIMAVISYFFMNRSFLIYLSDYARRSYEAVIGQADEHARNVAEFLEESKGDFNSLKGYLEIHDLGCIVWDEDGRIIFAYTEPVYNDYGAIASARQEVLIAEDKNITLQIWTRSIPQQALIDSLRNKVRIGLSALNACIFLLMTVLIFTILVIPIIRLRKTMRRYYEHGELPERSERQDEIGKLQNTFAEMVGVLQAKEQAEHRLVASISHDIKTPLTSVMGYTERLLTTEMPPEKQRQYLQCVYDKAVSIKTLVDKFDEFLDVGLKDTVPMRPVKAREICCMLQEEYGAELEDTGAEFEVNCLCPESRLICNTDELKRFFGNLIENSIRHSGAEHLKLHITCQKQGEQIEFLFWDNGQGVAPELLLRIFEPFYTTDRGRKVSGLGLSICKSIAKAHGGTVSAENVPDGGLMIRLLLPCIRN
mgnify:CR=1 FL=1